MGAIEKVMLTAIAAILVAGIFSIGKGAFNNASTKVGNVDQLTTGSLTAE